ncbi:MAG: class I SAM-dependent methyltransferase [Candidatus Hodarchaeota archaeon]
MKEQMKKFLIKGFYGFNTILMYGIGRRLGIFDYLLEKKKSSSSEDKSSVSFTLEELSENLNLDIEHLDAWGHLSLECGLFEIDHSCERCLKSAPHVFDLLIDRNGQFYIGDTVGAFYWFAPYQDMAVECFKTGNIITDRDVSEEVTKDTMLMGARAGTLTERLFATNFKDFCRNLRKSGNVLAVGCGYGFNLQIWAKKYKKAQFVGIDINPKAVEFAKGLFKSNNMDDRVEIHEIPINEYVNTTNQKFDLILLNHVLHEMNHDENYRIKALNDLYSLLKENGLLLVGESMIPDTFTPKKEFQLFDIMHKFMEIGFAKFYDEKTFKEFVNLTKFSKAEFVKKGGEYFWALKK